MLDLYVDWGMVGQEHGLDEEGIKGAGAEGCLEAYVGKKEVADQEKGWVTRETCLQVDVMEKVEVQGEGWVPVIIMRESYLKTQSPWDPLS